MNRKKRTFRALWTFLLLTAMLGMTACAGAFRGDGNGTEASSPLDTAESGTKKEVESDSTPSGGEEKKMKVLFSKDASYTLVRTEDKEIGDLAATFLSAIKKKTGLRTVKLVEADSAETTAEILIGDLPSREASISGMAATPYTHGTAAFIGEKLVISAYTPELAEKVLNKVLDALEENENGEWCVPEDLSLRASGSIALTIPTLWTARTEYQGFYISNNNRYQVALEMPLNADTLADYTAYCTRLLSEGYSLYSSNQIGENRFATYVTDRVELHLMWYASLSSLRIVYASRGYLPEQAAPAYTKLMESTVAQPAREAVTYAAAGESYVVQLEDGSFVIIDGGPGKEADVIGLMDWLTAHKPEADDKPRVTWMFTHLHNDHMELPVAFLKKYYAAIDLQTVCYNFPRLGTEDGLNDQLCTNNYNGLRSVLASHFSDTNIYVFHSGQKMYLPGCEIEFLFTQEDYWPQKFPTANHTSSAWRMTFTGGKTFMVLGDCEYGLCVQMASVYGDYLKSDVLQLSHHGLNGACLELYQAIDPKVCFWPLDEYRMMNDGRALGLYAQTTDKGYSYTNYAANPDKTTVWEAYRFNYWLRNTQWTRGRESGDRSHYHNSTTVIVKMTDLSVTLG